MFTFFKCVLVVHALCFHLSISDDILGCGGFVKSDVPIDFSQIEIQLFTLEGLLKYQTECAPNNGYFMVPYVEKGSFILKIDPPEGWLFDPMSVNLNVDGVNDDCSKGKDINFLFKGFFVSGQISGVASQGFGPRGVTIELHSLKSDHLIKTTKSLEKGSFIFEGVLPGEYQVKAVEQSYMFDKKSTSVSVTTSNTKCNDDLIVAGYHVKGEVTAQLQPVSGVHLLLFAKFKLVKEVENCNTSKPEGAVHINSDGFPHFVCSVISEGQYLFKNLPSGEYAIIPFHKGVHTQYEVEPSKLKVIVLNDHVSSKTDFQVTGYSVQGRVLTAENGKSVEGAQIYIADKLQGFTDVNGYYTFKHKYESARGSKEASIDILVKKEDLEFTRQKIVVDPNLPLLPTIVPHSFSVCGLVEVTDPPADFDATLLVVEISQTDSSANIQRSNLDKNGLFCFMKSAGEYILRIEIPKNLEKKGLALLPYYEKAKVESSPVKNIAFYQHRADCKIKLSCIDSCLDVVVELTSLATGKKNKAVVTENLNQTLINFNSILPGEYTISAHHNHWCWTSEKEKVIIPREKQDGVIELAHLKQSGFLLVCSITHDVEMVIHHDGEEVNRFLLKKGRNRLCLSNLGKYTLEPHSCHRFDVQSPIIYDTANPRPITLHALAHQAIVVLETTKSYLESELYEEKISVQVRSSRGKVIKDYFVRDEEDNTINDIVLYRLTNWASDGESLEIIPSSSLLLFEPKKLSLTMQAGDCAKELGRFKGIVGMFLSGHVTPPLANVNIVITTNTEPLITLKTGKDGTYRIGPVHPDSKYKISASLEDYALSPDEGKRGCFLAKKLSKLIFKITLENSNTPLPGVLISISGGNYRSNNLTGSDGSLTLVKLEPGSYYFKAIMKEYLFDPPSKVLEITEGVKTEIKISGKRVAYSAYGAVTSLNGEPEIGVHVMALSRDDSDSCRGLGEEGFSENDGNFRIRGLRPGCTYDVTVRDKEEKFNRISPQHRTVIAGSEDIDNVRFIAFRPLSGFELSGYIITSTEYLPFIKIVLYRAGEGSTASPIQVVSLGKETPFFQFPNLPRDGKEYVAKLECSLSSNSYDYTAPAAGFFAVGPHKHITFRFEPQRKSIEIETSQTSFLTLPFTLLIIFIAYNHTAVFVWINELYRKYLKKNAGNDILARGTRKPKK